MFRFADSTTGEPWLLISSKKMLASLLSVLLKGHPPLRIFPSLNAGLLNFRHAATGLISFASVQFAAPIRLFAVAAVFSLFLLLSAGQGVGATLGDDNPNGVAGDYNGSVTTAGHIDPLTGNAKRVIDDITVPGSVGAYPLKWSRYLNTRGGTAPNTFGSVGGWRHSYGWGLTILPPLPPPNEWEPVNYVGYPDGRWTYLYPISGGFYVPAVPGRDQVHERVLKTGGGAYGEGYYDLLLGDGGKVHFEPVPNAGLAPVAVVDPYGLTTTLTYVSGRLDTVKEPGGRYLKINYNSNDLIRSVQAYDRVGGSVIETVSYTYALVSGVPDPYYKLTGVDYGDGT
jgi:hypothetical protein